MSGAPWNHKSYHMQYNGELRPESTPSSLHIWVFQLRLRPNAHEENAALSGREPGARNSVSRLGVAHT